MNIQTKTYYFPIEKILLRLNETTLAMRFLIQNFESDFEIKEEVSEKDLANILNSNNSKNFISSKQEIIIEIHIFDELKEINFTIMNCTSGDTINTTVKVEEYAKHFNSSILFKKDPITWFKHMTLSKDSISSIFFLEEKIKGNKDVKEQINWSLFIEEYDEIYKKSVKLHRTNFLSTNNFDFKEFYSTPVVSMKKFVESIFTTSLAKSSTLSSAISTNKSSVFESSNPTSEKIFSLNKNNKNETLKYDDEIFRQNKLNQGQINIKSDSRVYTDNEKNIIINNLFCRYKHLLDLYIVNESLFIDFKEILMRCHQYLNANVTKTINEIEKVYSEEIDNLFLESLDITINNDNDNILIIDNVISKGSNVCLISRLKENIKQLIGNENCMDRINYLIENSQILSNFNECYLAAYSIPPQYKIHEVINGFDSKNRRIKEIINQLKDSFLILVETVNSTKYAIICDINLSSSIDKNECYYAILNFQDMSNNLQKYQSISTYKSTKQIFYLEDATNDSKTMIKILFEEDSISNIIITIKSFYKSLVEPPNKVLFEGTQNNEFFDYSKTIKYMNERKQKREELYNRYSTDFEKEQARNKGLFTDFEINPTDSNNNLYLNVYNVELIILKKNI